MGIVSRINRAIAPAAQATGGFTGGVTGSNIPNVAGPIGATGTVQPSYQTSVLNTPMNINQLSAQGIQGAAVGTAANMFNPLQGANIAAYESPYTQQVINQTAADLARQEAMQQNVIGAQAQAAGAFGGSREAIQRAATSGAYQRNLADVTAGLRQAGFQQAQQAAQTDIANRLQAAGQLADISNLGFGMGQTVQQNLAMQGAMQQALQQQLIDAAAAQYAGYQGAPQQGIGYLTSALGTAPVPQSSTSSQKSSPGLLDVASTGATIYSAIAL